MKKIDIITLHRVRNYGSSLQTFATQQFFKNIGFKTEIIDYYPERYSSLGLLKRLKNKSVTLEKNPILLFGARIIISISYIKKKIVFDNFLKKYIDLTSKTYRTEEDLLNDIPKADAYCTGSDQVWNSYWNEGIDKPLYLSFMPNNCYKFSYASSIGNGKISNEEIRQIKPYIQQYKHITVRENSGVNIMNNMGINDSYQVLDPTLLFKQDFWNNYTSNKFKNQKYVVTYNLHHDKKIDIYANKVAKQHNLKVFNISYNFHDIIRNGILKWCPKIEEYLGLIRDAQYVITDSFHATVFSLIFHKNFMVIYPNQANSRLKSILELLNLQELGFYDMPNIEAINTKVNFDDVELILDRERQKSFNYLNIIKHELGDNCE